MGLINQVWGESFTHPELGNPGRMDDLHSREYQFCAGKTLVGT